MQFPPLNHCAAICMIAGASTTYAADFYVSPDGSNDNTGDAPGSASAYQTIEYAVSQMSSGDTCYVQAGSYHESINLSSKSGLTIAAYGDGPVLMDGTLALPAAWAQHDNDIYKLS